MRSIGSRGFTTVLAMSMLVAGCEKTPDIGTYQSVVADVAAGRLVIGPNGEIVLPPELAPSVVNGTAYATARPTGAMVVVFPTWRGKGTNLRGSLYSAGPALAVGASVTVNIAPPSNMSNPQFAETSVIIDSTVAPSWYMVSRSLD